LPRIGKIHAQVEDPEQVGGFEQTAHAGCEGIAALERRLLQGDGHIGEIAHVVGPRRPASSSRRRDTAPAPMSPAAGKIDFTKAAGAEKCLAGTPHETPLVVAALRITNHDLRCKTPRRLNSLMARPGNQTADFGIAGVGEDR
jgi:hypothetical protein